jgi:hypothetical protein
MESRATQKQKKIARAAQKNWIALVIKRKIGPLTGFFSANLIYFAAFRSVAARPFLSIVRSAAAESRNMTN